MLPEIFAFPMFNAQLDLFLTEFLYFTACFPKQCVQNRFGFRVCENFGPASGADSFIARYPSRY